MTPIMTSTTTWHVFSAKTADELEKELNRLQHQAGCEIYSIVNGTGYAQFHIVYKQLETMSYQNAR